MNPDLTKGMERLPWPSDRRSTQGLRFSQRMRRAAWLGLFGCASKFCEPHSAAEKESAGKRMGEYVKRLKDLGVEPTPEEEA